LIGVGPFVVDSPIARGGMGEVWSGKHRIQGYAVAVKFLTQAGFRREGYLQAFRNEARAIAGLSHPNIVTVHGWGEVSATAAASSEGRIPEGAPWIALEMVTGGTLAAAAGRLTWPEIAAVVEGLLGALAHAHARGIIHRDLKPSNVLVQRDEREPVFAVKLTDFGLAQEVEAADVAAGPLRGGTPAYMAPERFDGRWRDDGPWTDLYSAGCLLWALLHGQPPFGTEGTFDHKRRQHQQEALPPFLPSIHVPAGFDAWLFRLLEKDPAERFRRAADAAYAFSLLGGPDASTPTGASVRPPSGEITLVIGERTLPREPPTDPMEAGGHVPAGLLLAARALDVPPVPADWRTPAGPGERSDRVLERARLWRQLRLAADERLVHGVLLLGKEKSGKTALGDWLACRAHEAGVAHVLRAGHSSIPGAGDGLGAALRSLFRCQGMDRDAAIARIEDILGRHGAGDVVVAESLADLVVPDGRRHSGPSDEHGAIRTVLQILTEERTVLLWLDDVHHGIPSLRFAAWLAGLEPPAPLPVLLLLAADPDGLTVGTVEEALAGAFGAHPRVATIEV
jgi:hypothetical protein